MQAKNTKTILFIFTFLVFASWGFSTLAEENSSSENIFIDSDQDGLSDEEENNYGTDPEKKDTDGDGYSDGSEVKTGYNPLVPAPGDKMNTDENEEGEEDGIKEDETLTNQISNDVADLLVEKNREKEGIGLEEISSLVDENIKKEISFKDLPEIEEGEIKIKKQDYDSLSKEERLKKEKEDALRYLTTTSFIIISNLPGKISSVEEVNGFMEKFISNVYRFSSSFDNLSYFHDLAGNGEQMLDQLKIIEVPENFLELHKKGIKLAKYAISLKEEIKEGDKEKDPIKVMLKLSKAENILVLGSEYFKELDKETERLGIETPTFDFLQ